MQMEYILFLKTVATFNFGYRDFYYAKGSYYAKKGQTAINVGPLWPET